MALQRRRDGEKIRGIPVADWNAFVETALAHRAGKTTFGQSPRDRVIADAGIFPLANASDSTAIEIYSVVGLQDLGLNTDRGLQKPCKFKSASINPERVAVVSERIKKSGAAPAVYDGLTPCRIKLNQDPSVFHSRATPVAGHSYMLADEIGLYDVIWHSDLAIETGTTAEQGDEVYAIVRIGRPVREWVSVRLNYSSSIAEPIDAGGGNYIYRGEVADTVIGSLSGSTISTPVWVLFGGGVKDMTFWESDLLLDGYFHGFYEHDDETRPLITIPENPVKKLFGKWTSSPGDTGSVDIYVDRSTQLGTYSVSAGATKMGNVSAANAWVYVEHEYHASLGREWEVTAESCPDA